MATQTYEQLIAGANKIKENELPESNTHNLVGDQLVQMTSKMQEESGKKLAIEDLASERGDSSKTAMTQAAVTAELNNIDTKFSELVYKIIKLTEISYTGDNTNVGEYFYNPYLKAIRYKKSDAEILTVNCRYDAVYIIKEGTYVWNGESLVSATFNLKQELIPIKLFTSTYVYTFEATETTSKYINSDGISLGVSDVRNTLVYSKLLKVKKGLVIKNLVPLAGAEFNYLFFYDADLNCISSLKTDSDYSNQTVTLSDDNIPEGAVYCRGNFTNDNLNPLNDYSVVYLDYDDLKKIQVNKCGYNLNEFDENPLAKISQSGGMTAIFHTIGAIGGSLASGEHEYKKTSGVGYKDMYEYSWIQRIAAICGNKAYNFSSGGQSTESWLRSSYYTQVETDLCQAYFIMLGNNDLTKEYPLGTESDINIGNESSNAESFYGYYSRIIARLKEVQPKCVIFVMTIQRNYVSDTEKVNQYNEAIKYMATIYDNVFVIDYNKYGVDWSSNGWFRQNYSWGGHLVATGYQYMAYELCTYVDWIIRSNPTKFKEVAFIGTPYSHTQPYN